MGVARTRQSLSQAKDALKACPQKVPLCHIHNQKVVWRNVSQFCRTAHGDTNRLASWGGSKGKELACWLGIALTVTRMNLALQLYWWARGGASTIFSTSSPRGLGNWAGDKPGWPGPAGVILKLSNWSSCRGQKAHHLAVASFTGHWNDERLRNKRDFVLPIAKAFSCGLMGDGCPTHAVWQLHWSSLDLHGDRSSPWTGRQAP